MTGCSEALNYSVLDYFAITVFIVFLILAGLKVLMFLWEYVKKALTLLAKGFWHLLTLILEGITSH